MIMSGGFLLPARSDPKLLIRSILIWTSLLLEMVLASCGSGPEGCYCCLDLLIVGSPSTMIIIDWVFLLIVATSGVVHFGLSYDVYVNHLHLVCMFITFMALDVHVVSSCHIGRFSLP